MFQSKLGHLQVLNCNFKVGYKPEVNLIYVKTCCSIRQTVLSSKYSCVETDTDFTYSYGVLYFPNASLPETTNTKSDGSEPLYVLHKNP